MSKPIDDNNHFRYFAPDPPASIPEGTSMPLELKTAAELVAERKAWIANSKTCDCCKGLGRIAIATEPPSAFKIVADYFRLNRS